MSRRPPAGRWCQMIPAGSGPTSCTQMVWRARMSTAATSPVPCSVTKAKRLSGLKAMWEGLSGWRKRWSRASVCAS